MTAPGRNEIDRLLRDRIAELTRMREVLEAAPDAMVVAGADGRIVLVNKQAEKQFGYAREELLGQPVEMLIPEHLRSRHPAYRAAYVGDAHAGPTGAGRELYARRKDGSQFPVEINLGPVHAGHEVLVAAAIRDITARRNVEAAKEAAEAANRAKSAFLAHMSHEIRTPMNAILGYTQLLERDPDVSQRRRYLEIIRHSGDHLLDLINDVLEMSKIEAGHRQVARAGVDLWALLDDVRRMFELRTEAAVLCFEIQRSRDVPRHIITDAGKLRQVLVNLLGNAIKFTKRGGVVARISTEPAEGGGVRLIAEVEDTGPGISPEEVSDLFEPFRQARAGTQARSGTGLGLAISREFARMMGGDLTVRSHVGKGSVFRFEVPIELGDGSLISPPAPKSGRVIAARGKDGPIRILLTDDDEEGRGWLSRLLANVGFDVREAGSGEEAVASCEQHAPHLVLMDMNMPGMDGYAAMRAIRALPVGGGTPIVAVTAVAFDEARDSIFDAGANGWLRKPCREGELLEEIRRHVEVEYHYAAAPPRSSSSGRFAAVRRLPSMAGLPPEMRAALRKAALIGDIERLNELIEDVSREQPVMALELQRLADRFAYDEIDIALRAPDDG